MFGRRKNLACSFCGKGAGDVAKLVAGPKVSICDTCVALAHHIMEEDSVNPPASTEPRIGLLQRLIKRFNNGQSRGIHSYSECETIAH